MQLSSYAADLQILPESAEEEEKFLSYCKETGHKPQRFYSNVTGQSWFGKFFYEIAFRADLFKDIAAMFNAKRRED